MARREYLKDRLDSLVDRFKGISQTMEYFAGKRYPKKYFTGFRSGREGNLKGINIVGNFSG